MPETVAVSKVDRTLRIHLDRADKRNAVTLAMYEAMTRGIAQAKPMTRSGWSCSLVRGMLSAPAMI